MARHIFHPLWSHSLRVMDAMTRSTVRASTQALKQAMRPAQERRKAPPGQGEWITGMAMGPAGMRRYHLFRPSGVHYSERLPLLVMLHGCGQDAKSFALSTRMNRIAARERFFVLYPEQDRRAHPQGCWNWYDTRSGHAFQEAATLIAAVDQACLFYPIDPGRVAIAGLSAGASMAALLVTRHPSRFKAIAMHSGVPPGTANSTASALGAMRGRKSSVAMPLPTASASSWPPLLVIHGSADPVVAVENGLSAAQLWADAAHARADADRRLQRGNRYEMTVTDFRRKGATIASLCVVQTLGHAWSGGDGQQAFTDARGPDASRMVWAFVERQFRKGTEAVSAAPAASGREKRRPLV
jgi:poly(hydroxyalkanoate) depolymerase family esterase